MIVQCNKSCDHPSQYKRLWSTNAIKAVIIQSSKQLRSSSAIKAVIFQGSKQLWPSKATDVLTYSHLLGHDAVLLVQCSVAFIFKGLWTRCSEMSQATYPSVQSHIPEDHNLQLRCSYPPKVTQMCWSHNWTSTIHIVVSDIHGAFCAAGDGATCGTGWTDESSGALVSWRHVSTDTHTRISVSCTHISDKVFLWAPRFLAVCQTSGCQSLKPRVGALCRSWVFLLLPWHHSKLPCSCPGGTSSAGNRRSARDDRTLVSRVQVAEKLR